MAASKAETNRRKEIEDWLDSYNVSWEFIPGADLNEVDLVRSLKNQARLEPLNEPTVERYEVAWLTGATFPPIVVQRTTKTSKRLMIDGNHRAAGAMRAKVPTVDRYEVTGAKAATVAAMCREANNFNGLSLSEDERIINALFAADNLGISLKEAAAQNQVPLSKVQRKSAETSALKRAQENDIDLHLFTKLSAQIRGRLNNVNPDEIFVGATNLTIKAHLKIDEVNDLITMLNAARSFAAKEKVIKTWVKNMEERIQDNLGGRKTNNSRAPMTPRQRFGMAMGNLSVYDDYTAVLEAYSDAELPDFLEGVEATIAKFQAIYEKGMARL
jgi:hypothetical protein